MGLSEAAVTAVFMQAATLVIQSLSHSAVCDMPVRHFVCVLSCWCGNGKTEHQKLMGSIMPVDVITWPPALHDRTAYLIKTRDQSQGMNDVLLMRGQTLIRPLNVRCQHLLASLPISSVAYTERFET